MNVNDLSAITIASGLWYIGQGFPYLFRGFVDSLFFLSLLVGIVLVLTLIEMWVIVLVF